ncbi:hypothetical protein FERRO_14440 [Ferrovum sp. JA12]|nr:hypothetical protein FERRO_14440 [Ferrovum sp. JA12]
MGATLHHQKEIHHGKHRHLHRTERQLHRHGSHPDAQRQGQNRSERQGKRERPGLPHRRRQLRDRRGVEENQQGRAALPVGDPRRSVVPGDHLRSSGRRRGRRAQPDLVAQQGRLIVALSAPPKWRGAFEFSVRVGRISVKAPLRLRASAASRFHEFAIPWNSVNARSRLRASVVFTGKRFRYFQGSRNSVRPPADAGARCRAAHRATLGVSPLRLPSLTPARFACCNCQRWGLACCSLHLTTAFSPSRSARALHAKVCACLARWRPAAVCEP